MIRLQLPRYKERQRVEPTVPDVVHHASTDTSYTVLAAEPEALLDPGMKPVEVRSQTLVRRSNSCSLRFPPLTSTGRRKVPGSKKPDGGESDDGNVQRHRIERSDKVLRSLQRQRQAARRSSARSSATKRQRALQTMKQRRGQTRSPPRPSSRERCSSDDRERYHWRAACADSSWCANSSFGISP